MLSPKEPREVNNRLLMMCLWKVQKRAKKVEVERGMRLIDEQVQKMQNIVRDELVTLT